MLLQVLRLGSVQGGEGGVLQAPNAVLATSLPQIFVLR